MVQKPTSQPNIVWNLMMAVAISGFVSIVIAVVMRILFREFNPTTIIGAAIGGGVVGVGSILRLGIKSNSRLPLILMGGGIWFLTGGGSIIFLMLIAQITTEHPEDWMGILVLFALCPIPLIAAGGIILLLGISLHRKAEKPELIG